MPKAKITSSQHPAPAAVASGSNANRTPVKINTGGTPLWYKIIMFGVMVIGLAWLVVNYLAGPSIPLMNELGPWNFAVGFGLFIIGLLMTMAWR